MRQRDGMRLRRKSIAYVEELSCEEESSDSSVEEKKLDEGPKLFDIMEGTGTSQVIDLKLKSDLEPAAADKKLIIPRKEGMGSKDFQ